MEQKKCSLENMEINFNFWKNKSVFITGHTGFKGGWLALWLSELGANVYGYSLKAPTDINFFKVINLKKKIKKSTIGDIRNLPGLQNSICNANPSIIFHMAAQSLVRQSYVDPLETFSTNLIGTINVFEAARKIKSVKAIVNITTDKCYENYETNKPYSEIDRLGGLDPYSSSKACSEIATSAYRSSFLNKSGIKIASARAGNVIGGGDWANDRLIPDFFRSIDNNKILNIRSPKAVRPWQHVLDPLSGYLMLAEKLVNEGDNFAEAWNFGPENTGTRTVSWILKRFSKKFKKAKFKINKQKNYHESKLLNLNISKAKSKLGWKPVWSIESAIDNTIEWYENYKRKENMLEFSIKQIKAYQSS
jgi:CDP-glucose 4,6-dehydratase